MPPKKKPGPRPLGVRRTRSTATSVRLSPREKATLMRYCIENDISESHAIRQGLFRILREAYPDFETVALPGEFVSS